jgi:dTMP kinase
VNAPRFYGIRPPGIQTEPFPGRLIVIEGTDGVGRSTQIALLREWLEDKGYAVVQTGFRRSDLASRGIQRAKRGHTLDPLTLNLFYATDFWDRLERHIIPALRAGMVALVDRYIYSLIARAVLRGVPRDWMQDVYGMALVPDRVFYLDIRVEQLVPRVINTTGLDYWESGQDYLRGNDLYHNYVDYQLALLAEYKSMAAEYDFHIIDGSQPVGDVFKALKAAIQDVIDSMAPAAPVPPTSSPTDGARPADGKPSPRTIERNE